ncbi:Asp/Glu racemase [Bordetella muralis]|uniref:maleate cis-trans isomerase family protein n=1 Tax=Bordetella muralis TaxID=1649130 RepID=UPI0039EE26EF
MDGGLMSRAALGLIVLSIDQTMEYEWRRIIDLPGVAFFESRIPCPPDITPALLMEMHKDIATGTALLLPGIDLQVVAFGCTSGSIVIGEEEIFSQIRRVRPGVACTTPITAAMAGLKALNAKRIALLTPYVESVNNLFKKHIEEKGVEISRIATFNHAVDADVACIDAETLKNAILKIGAAPDVEAVFVSCTSLRMCDHTREIEQLLGKPVLASNSAMAWHALRLAGIDDVLPQWGRLFEV